MQRVNSWFACRLSCMCLSFLPLLLSVAWNVSLQALQPLYIIKVILFVLVSLHFPKFIYSQNKINCFLSNILILSCYYV